MKRWGQSNRKIARAFRTALDTGTRERFTADELLVHLIDAEWDERHNRATSRLIKKARFPSLYVIHLPFRSAERRID